VPRGADRCSHCGAPPPEDVTTAFTGARTRFARGDVIDGRYEVVAILPTGGMGELYKVRHVHLGDFRVVKVRKPLAKRDETGQKRFAREAQLAASLKHQNLATLYDFATLPDGSHYMVFEFVDGLTVAEHIQAGGRFETTQVLRVAEQTLKALSVLHNAGIIHRDIASDNLMLAVDPDGETIVKVIDLGIAKPLDGEGLTSTGFFVGKARYASPEQVNTQDPAPIDTRSDLYSLGVVLYEMVSGDVPFAGSTPAASVIKRLTEEITTVPPRDTSMILEPDVEAFILSLLRRDRNERVQSADQALAVVRQLLSRRPDANDGSALARITRDKEIHKLAADEPATGAPIRRKGTMEMSLDEIQKAQLDDIRDVTGHGSVPLPPPPPHDEAILHVEETEALPRLDKQERDRLMADMRREADVSKKGASAPELPSVPDDAAPTMPFAKYKGALPGDKGAEPAPPITTPPPFMTEPPQWEPPATPVYGTRLEPEPDKLPTRADPVTPPPEPPPTVPVPLAAPSEPPPTVPVQIQTPPEPSPPLSPPSPEPAPEAPEPAGPIVVAVEGDGRRRMFLILALLAFFALLAIGVAGYAAWRIFQKISVRPRAGRAGNDHAARHPDGHDARRGRRARGDRARRVRATRSRWVPDSRARTAEATTAACPGARARA
jgi:serine/threonine protein kinase